MALSVESVLYFQIFDPKWGEGKVRGRILGVVGKLIPTSLCFALHIHVPLYSEGDTSYTRTVVH